MAHPPEWHEARRKGIGGSDWGHVLQIEPYGCARRLWYLKTGTAPDVEPKETGPMRRGTLLEPLVADEYARDTGRKVRRPGRLPKHGPAEWWIGNIDRMIVSADDYGPGVLECKTVHPSRFLKIKRSGLPEEWVAQVQHYLGLTGWQWGIVAMLEPVAWQYLPWWVDRDDELIEQMVVAGDRFWRAVEHGPMPPRIEPADRRCQSCPWRISCQGCAIFDAVPLGDDEVKEITDPTLEDLVRQRQEIKAVKDDADALIKDLGQQIREHLGGLQKVAVGNYRVYYTDSMSSRVDLDALRKAHPDIVSEYTLPRRSTRLTIYE